MRASLRPFVLWFPRVLSIAFALFISIFALDVFDERLPFWQTVGALLLHLIPTAVVVALVVAAWRWPVAGAAGFAALGALYLCWMAARFGQIRWSWFAVIGTPLFGVAALFLVDSALRRRARRHA